MAAVYSAFFGSEAPGRRREAGVDTAAREAYNNPALQTAARPGGGFCGIFKNAYPQTEVKRERQTGSQIPGAYRRPVGHLVCKMAVPTIISMMVTACYNMVDTYFVGQLHSNSATGAVGVVFSLMAVIQAVGFFFGHGSGNYISRQLGRHETADAEKMAATGVTLAFLAGCVILVLGQIFLSPLARLLGSTDTILPYARSYLRISLLGPRI